jgi:hypothetical protein
LEVDALPKRSDDFHGLSNDADKAARTVEATGLTIVSQSRLGIAVVGPPGAYEQLTGGKITTWERLVYAEAATRRYVTHLDISGTNQPKALGCGTPGAGGTGIEAIVLERPRSPQATAVWPTFQAYGVPQSGGIWPSPIPPTAAGYYLRAPQDIALGLGAPGAHQLGFRGQGVLVAMVDTGHFLHPFFTAHHYQVRTPIAMVPGTNSTVDVIGHGTGESANIFAGAPDAQLQPIRASNQSGDLVAPVAGFMKAKELNPKVLTNSWGGDMVFPPSSNKLSPQDAAFALEIKDAVEQGIFVVFSGGNGQFSLEPQVPEVFAAGGVYMAANMALQASNYASGYKSPFFANRTVPDACGLVGLLPRAMYLMLPVAPSCELDIEMSNSDQDGNSGDGTAPNDGWALFSGTSAAAPQIAGVAAILLSAKPNLTPAQIKEALIKTSIDVVAGRCHPRFNNVATNGNDLATGHGLVHAIDALHYVQEHF